MESHAIAWKFHSNEVKQTLQNMSYNRGIQSDGIENFHSTYSLKQAFLI